MASSENLSHRGLASNCFNKVWDYLDKSSLSEQEIDEMVHVAHASFWHWTQVEDHTPQNLSIGTWQLSRVYAVAGLPERAEHFSNRCIDVSEAGDLPPFFVGYAYETAARAKALMGDANGAKGLVAKGQALAEQVDAEEDRKALLDDLRSIS